MSFATSQLRSPDAVAACRRIRLLCARCDLNAPAVDSLIQWRRSSDRGTPARSLTAKALRQQTLAFHGTGGVSAENCSEGFAPAFLDTRTGAVYRACYADGRPAPMHLLEGLPASVVAVRDSAGKVVAVKPSVIAGFVRCEQFYTREQAAAWAMNSTPPRESG